MNKSKSRAIRRRSARKIRGGALEILKPNYNNIAPAIKPLILAAIISSIMHQNIQESTAMFVTVLSIIAEQLTVADIELIFPDASIKEIKSIIAMLNGDKSISFHHEPATPVIQGGRRRTKTKYRLRSKTHKHQIQSGGNKKFLYMMVLFISACYFIYIGIMGMTTQHVSQPLSELTTAGQIFRKQYTTGITAPALLDHIDDLIGSLTNAVAAKTRYSGWMFFNSRDFLQEQIGGILHTPEIKRIMDEIMRTVQDLTSSLDTKSSTTDRLRYGSIPLVDILTAIIWDTLPRQIVTQINSAMINSVIQSILGSGLGWLFYGLFKDNGRDDDDAHQNDGLTQILPPPPPPPPPHPPGSPPPPFPPQDHDHDHDPSLSFHNQKQQERRGATSPTHKYYYIAPVPLPTKDDVKARPPYPNWFARKTSLKRVVSPKRVSETFRHHHNRRASSPNDEVGW